MTLRTLPLRIEYIDDETLRSYVNRLATELQTTVGATLRATGLLVEDTQAERSGFGVDLTPDRLQRLCFTTGLSEAQARGLLFRRLDRTALDLSTCQPDDPATFRGFGHEVNVFANGSHACPRCLERDGAWRMRWRLPWSFCCPRHGCLLLTHCPGCSQRLHLHHKQSMLPPFRRIVPRRGVCDNPPPRGRSRHGSFEPCLHDLTPLRTADVSCLIEVQRRLHQVVNGAVVTVGGTFVESLQFLRDVRCLLELVMSGTDPDELLGIPQPALDALTEYQARWDHAREASLPGRYARVAGRLEDPALMAALLPIVLDIVDEPSPEALADRLVPLLDRGYQRRRHTANWALWRRKNSEALQVALDDAHTRSSYASFRSRIGLAGPGGRVRPQLTDLETRHVPQAFWVAPYCEQLSRMLPGVSADTGRMLCSALLVRLIEPGTSWPHAAAQLGLGTRHCNQTADNVLWALSRQGKIEEFSDGLRAIARDQARKDPIDYRQRRAVLADWRGLTKEMWTDVCAFTGGRNYVRSAVYASVWIWTELTGGYYKHCPLLTDVPTSLRSLHGHDKSRRTIWATYCASSRRVSPVVAEVLHAVAATVLRARQAGRTPSRAAVRRTLADLAGSRWTQSAPQILHRVAESLGRSIEDLTPPRRKYVAERDLALLVVRCITGHKQVDLCAELDLGWKAVNGGCCRAVRRVREDPHAAEQFRRLVASHGGPTDIALPELGARGRAVDAGGRARER